jgi:TorA maturation chaperone TorD
MHAPESGKAAAAIDEVDLARAAEYSLLATLLVRSPDAEMLRRLAALRGDDSRLGLAHSALARAAARSDVDITAREYFALFVGLGRGEVMPYASHYLTGFVHGRPLANLRQTLRRIGIERVETQTEPEDHAAILLEIMAHLARREIDAPPGSEREIFENYLAPWIAHFFSDLENSASVDFYAAVGMLGRTFTEIESQGFLMPNL